MCFENAFRGVARTPGAYYVEGYVALEFTPAPITHGWIELAESGILVDPSPIYCAADTAALAYFAGRRWTLSELMTMLKAHRYRLTLPFSEFQADAGCNAGLAADHTILKDWRHAVERCHAFPAARHREQSGTPQFGSKESEAEWLAQERSLWT